MDNFENFILFLFFFQQLSWVLLKTRRWKRKSISWCEKQVDNVKYETKSLGGNHLKESWFFSHLEKIKV